jgi:CheY-like chemotaxis protein
MSAAITVLVADDEPDLLVLTGVVLERAGFEVVDRVVDGEAALAAVAQHDPPPVPTVMVLDYLMPGLTGLDVAERVLEAHPEQRIVLFSAFIDREIERRAAAIGVRSCVSKSDITSLPDVVASLAAED